MAEQFASAMPPQLARIQADSLVMEVLPLLAAARFLEQRAEKILRRRRLGRRCLPFWLSGIDSEVWRVPYGSILIIGPSNYPLFLPGVQAMQGLVAGNAVIWKPGVGGKPVAELFAAAMEAAGLPKGLLRITDESIEAAEQEIAAGVDKVFLTGSAATGRAVLKRLADSLTPCVTELSGCDAMVILPSAELDPAVRALAFGMRLNGSATCIAPRRVLLVDVSKERRNKFLSMLRALLDEIEAVSVAPPVARQLMSLLEEAQDLGATVLGNASAVPMKPVLVLAATPAMRLARADIFAPVSMVIEVRGEAEILAAQQACPFGLACSIFGDETEARKLAAKLSVGTVSINDVIAATADPRIPFGGRGQSGFGVTRGTEGLLEMTAIKTIVVRRGSSRRHYEVVGKAYKALFDGLIRANHGGTFRERVSGMMKAITAGRRLAKK